MFGYIRDPLGHAYTKWRARFSAPAPEPSDIRSFAPKLLNQRNTSSCVGHGTSIGCYTALGYAAAHGLALAKLNWIPSPLGIYTLARRIDIADPFVPLQDTGTMPNAAIRGIQDFGIRPMLDQSADSDCDSVSVLRDPTFDELEIEYSRPFLGAYAVNDADEVRAALSKGHPVLKGTFVDSKYLDWQAGDPPLGRMNTSDQRGGGHLTCILASNADGTFWDRSSWGTMAGLGGEFLVNADHVNQADQLIAMGVK